MKVFYLFGDINGLCEIDEPFLILLKDDKFADLLFKGVNRWSFLSYYYIWNSLKGF